MHIYLTFKIYINFFYKVFRNIKFMINTILNNLVLNDFNNIMFYLYKAISDKWVLYQQKESK